MMKMAFGAFVKKLFVVLILSLILMAGCTQLGGCKVQQAVNKTVTTATGAVQNTEPPCETAYQFGTLADGTLGKQTSFTVTVNCAAGKTIALYIDDESVATQPLATNATTALNFKLAPKLEGTRKVEVKTDGVVINTTQWKVAALGSQDTNGSRNDPVSVKEWIATSYTVEAPVAVKSVGVFMRRLYTETLQNSYVIVELRSDNGGKPSDGVLKVATVPITKPTLSENWIWINFADGVTLQPGKYWVVLRVNQETDGLVSDVENVHYTANDTTTPGNDYTRSMLLEWDRSGKAFGQTEWKTLPYDRTYAVVLSGAAH